MLLDGFGPLFSAITGLSNYVSVEFFIICRALQGIGFALLIPCGMGILGNIYPNGERKNLVFGCVGANGPAGAFFGAFIAALIAIVVVAMDILAIKYRLCRVDDNFHDLHPTNNSSQIGSYVSSLKNRPSRDINWDNRIDFI